MIDPSDNHSARYRMVQALWQGRDPCAGFPIDLYQTDTQGWNSDHPYLREAIAEIKPTCIVEIGVWKGGSTITMAKKLKELALDGFVIAVDTWLGSSEHWIDRELSMHLCINNGYPNLFYKFMSNIIAKEVRDYVIPVPMDSVNASKLLGFHQVIPDIIHLDAGHDYRSVFSDLEAWWAMLRPGGIMIGDDYAPEGGWIEVRAAFDDFFGKLGITFANTAGKCLVRKPMASL